SSAALAAAPLLATTHKAMAQDKLAGSGEVVVHSYGGSYTEGFRRYVTDPFSKATGIKVVEVTNPSSEAPFLAMVRAGKVDWDFTMCSAVRHGEFSQSGWLTPFDYSLWDAETIAGIRPEHRLKDAVIGYF